MDKNFSTVVIVLIVSIAVVQIVRAIMAYLTVIKLEHRKKQLLKEIMDSEDAELIGHAVAIITKDANENENENGDSNPQNQDAQE